MLDFQVTRHKLKLKLGIRAGQHPIDKVSQKSTMTEQP